MQRLLRKRVGPVSHITLLWIAVILSTVVGGYSTVKVIEEQAHQNDALRQIMCHAEHVVRTQPGIPTNKRMQAIRFYDSSLRDAHLAPCPDPR